MPQIDPNDATPHRKDYQTFLDLTLVRFEALPHPRTRGVSEVFVHAPGEFRGRLPVPLAQDATGLTQVDLLRWVQRDVLGLLRMHDAPEDHPLHRAAVEAYVALTMVGEDLTFHGDLVGRLCATMEQALGEADFQTLIHEVGDAPQWESELPRAPAPGT